MNFNTNISLFQLYSWKLPEATMQSSIFRIAAIKPTFLCSDALKAFLLYRKI